MSYLRPSPELLPDHAGQLLILMKQSKYLPLLLVVVALGVVAWSLLTYEDNLLWKLQELNLHLNTGLFFKQQMVVAGGLLTWLGTFFTEFFRYCDIVITI